MTQAHRVGPAVPAPRSRHRVPDPPRRSVPPGAGSWRGSLFEGDPGQPTPGQPGSGQPGSGRPDTSDALDVLLDGHAVRAVYQPIVDLATRAPVAYEALARGPEGSALERPDLLFAAARQGRRLAELDRACRLAAVLGADRAGLDGPWTLFVNTEPEAATAGGWEPGGAGARPLVVELTERALTRSPAALLRAVQRLRRLGWGVALDDVGAERESLALLPLLRPDVVKLDLRLVQRRPTAAIAEIVNAVNAEAERSGALLLAEGIETEAHLRTALGMGATLGQGWLFGRPGALPEQLPPAPVRALVGGPPAVPERSGTPGGSPFEVAAASRGVRTADKGLLIEMSKHLERQAIASGESAVVLSTFQHARFFTPATAGRYRELVRHAAFVAALGEGMPAAPVPGVRGCDVHPADPVLGEWDVAVLAPHFAGALVARDLGDDGPDRDRRFAFVLTHDRDLVVEVAASLMTRVPPSA